MRVILTPDDLKKGDLVEPGWYHCDISKYEEEVVKGSVQKPSDGSTNCKFSFKVFDGPKKGVEMTKFFNEKALGFGKGLWKALDFPFDPEKGYELSTELFQQTVGSKIDVYVKRGKSDKGNDFNDPADFRPYKPQKVVMEYMRY